MTSQSQARTPGVIDLRSDTVTRPTPAMIDAMVRAPLGDDVLGDDPTVHRLESMVAGLLGKEAACFVPSGTMANQAALRAHTEPGDEVICHANSHIIHYETGAPAVVSGLMIRPVEGARGFFTPEDVEAAIRPDFEAFARTRLVVIENTNNRGGGSVWPAALIESVASAARARGLGVHLDGARLWNACAATGLTPADYARHADSVSVCFSKGLGTPAGSAVVGDAAFIKRVRRIRKMLGGAMRQSGLLAAAAIYALEHHRERLREDHAAAAALARGLSAVPGVRVDAAGVETNMVFFDLDDRPGVPDAAAVVSRCRDAGALVMATAPRRIRAVTHLDAPAALIAPAVQAITRAVRG